MLGLDTVSWRQIHGSSSDGRVELPAHTAFLDHSLDSGPAVALPKHNNYPRNLVQWDDHTAVVLPLRLLGISPLAEGETAGRPSDQRAVVAYVMFRTLAALLPEEYADDVRQRWGVGVGAQSAAFTLAVEAQDGVVKGETATPIRLQMQTTRLSAKSNPQCVRWKRTDR